MPPPKPTYKIASIPGDGIGPEVISAAITVLQKLASTLGTFSLQCEHLPWSSDYYKAHGRYIPDGGLEELKTFDAILFGSVGDPDVPDHISLTGLRLTIIRHLHHYANLRPTRLLRGCSSPLVALSANPSLLDWTIVRENSEGEYSGQGGRTHVGTPWEVATEVAIFTRHGVERIMRFAFETAQERGRKKGKPGKLCVVTKSNAQIHGLVLWDEVAASVSHDFPDVEWEKMLVDAMTVRMTLHPETLDTIVATNLHADILSDLAAALAGSIGITPTSNLDPTRENPSMFEPIHGSAFDLMGKGVANPIGAIWTAAEMLRWLGEEDAADALMECMETVTEEGCKTADLGGNARTEEVASEICRELERALSKRESGKLVAAMPPLVKNPQIQSATLLNPLPIFLHLYVWPFLAIWPVFLAFYLSEDRYNTYINGSEWTFVWAGSIITLQSLTWLTTKWNVNIDALFTCIKTREVRDASLIKVIPVTNAGSAEICKLLRDNVGGRQNTSFLFQKRRFLYNAEENSFAPMSYEIDKDPRPAIRTFQESQGLLTQEEIDRVQQHYGDNTFDIPVPTFTELWKEHAVAPFFIFQIFCVGLWLLDDYWYYSLFTLVMLVGFESTVVWQRQRTLNEFRGMSIQPYQLWVYRQRKWELSTSDKLLPGDLVSVDRTKEDSGVACDMLLVEGTAIINEAMLSGESTPLLKDSVQLRPGEASIDPEGLDKNAFLYGGTKVLQVTHGNASEDAPETVPTLASGTEPPPDKGAMAIVVKTGFETSQGSLVRTMIYSTERVSANNVEALLFILFLLVFAIAASWYVWVEGVAQDRKRSKLLLDCVLIITSVVPPELPMELSLAVNTSLAALSKYAIFCTEPFRIPFAGRVDIACFDKTGTLTGEDLVVDGIAGLSLGTKNATTEKDGSLSKLTSVLEAGQQTTLVLATAHALVKLDEGEIVGDPMEKATLSSLGWTLGRNDTLQGRSTATGKGNTGGGELVQIKRRFQFSSALKRQSSVATVLTTDRATGRKVRGTFVGVKGAPETIRKMLAKTPPNYEETFKYFTRNGGRVLALGYRYLSVDAELGQKKINDLKREEVEADLTFAGFLVLQCPLKEDAMQAVRMLNESSHRCVMITGDNPLTAVHVARQVEIIDRDVLILDAPEHDDSGKKLVWRSVDDKTNIPVDPSKPLDEKIIKEKDLCVTGYALSKYKNEAALPQLLRHTWVYARVSPKQKEDILLGLKDAGYTTLMCGDGTNDVGALKQAHIGVALLNGSQDDLNRISEHFRVTKMKEIYEKQVGIMKRFNQPPPPVPVQVAHLYPPGPTNPHYEKAMLQQAERKGAAGAVAANAPAAEKKEKADNTTPRPDENANLTAKQKKQQKAALQAAGIADKFTASMMEQELDESEPPRIKLGDASVAAPFTSKLANVIAIPNIIRQGRCTLVATIQMYKILALNCLISAYSLSVLYLEGIKFGDGQVTISGMLMSVCFLSISRAKSVEGLSKERPQPNIFNPYIIGSVLGQFAIHIATLIYLSRYVQSIEPRAEKIDLEGDFEPSLLNSAVYLLQLIQQISTFAINYQGRPFREGISENRGMYWGLVLVSGVAFSCSTEFIPELNEKLKLVPFSTEFKFIMTGLMIADYVGCYIIEVVLKHLYSDFRPKDIAVRRDDQLKAEEARKAKEAYEKIEEDKKIVSNGVA